MLTVNCSEQEEKNRKVVIPADGKLRNRSPNGIPPRIPDCEVTGVAQRVEE